MAPRIQRPEEPKAVRKSVSMTEELAQAIQRQAAAEGHNNFSAVIVAAVRDYLMRALLGQKAA